MDKVEGHRAIDTVYGRFSEQVTTHPGACAIRDEKGELTYAELSDLVDRIAVRLPSHATYIGVIMDHGAAQVATMLAVLRIGAAYVPAEPDFPVERVRFMMDECRVDCVVMDRAYKDVVQGHGLLVAEDLLDGGAGTTDTLPCPARPDSPAYVLYTSGTTGVPKGVVVENHNVCHYARAFEHEFHNGPGDIMLQYSVCSFDIFVEEVFATLLNGATLAIPPANVREDEPGLMRYVEDHGITIVSGFPYLLADINEHDNLPGCVRLLISGGDVLRERYVDRLLGQTDVYNTYGPSETTVCCTYFRCNGATALDDSSFPVGKAVAGATVEIMDEDLRPVATGHLGEICISGDGVACGYVDASKDAPFVTCTDGSHLYRSGDLGYELDSGDIAFVRRADSQVMIGGKRVEVNEVESVLNRCDGVRAGVVRADTDDQGLAYLTAYVVPEATGFDLAHAREQMARHLTPFMIPEFFVLLDELPRNANGKPDSDMLPTVLKISDEGVTR
jgi:amino acid adenylation domain-containing protein